MPKPTYRTRLATLAVASAAFLAMSGPALAADEAHVRVLHASPDAPAVDIYVDGAKVGGPLAGLEFGDISAYVSLPAGTHDLKVCAAADATVCPIEADGVALEAGSRYTVAATNVLASIEAQIITDEPAPVAGKTQVRVVHFSADTPAVDVLTQDGATVVVDAVAYPNATGYLTIDPGAYDLKVCADADNTVCPLDPGSLDLTGGASFSVFAVGSLTAAPPTLSALVARDAIAAPETSTESVADQPAGSLALNAVGFMALGTVLVLGAARLATRRLNG